MFESARLLFIEVTSHFPKAKNCRDRIWNTTVFATGSDYMFLIASCKHALATRFEHFNLARTKRKARR